MRARGLVRAATVLLVLSTMACGKVEDGAASWSGGQPPTTSPPVVPLAQGLGSAPSPTPPPSEPVHRRPPPPPPDAEPEPQLPPPPPPPPQGECDPSYQGEAAPRARVAEALAEAASRTYWPVSAPQIRVPENLLRATAWQESGWQSDIVACDGGVGLMQVMPATATWMNTRFGQSYDIHSYPDNAFLGATYLAWLIKYIGDWHFGGEYSVDPGDCAHHLDPCLLNAIIAAYNFGHQAVAPHDGQISIPNPRYVDNVRTLMTTCECLSY